MVAVRILGIDPGTVQVGFACLEVVERAAATRSAATPLAHRAGNVVQRGVTSGACRVVEVGARRLGRREPIPARLAVLAELVEELLARLHPDELALEEAFHGRSAQSALRVGEARGVVLAGAHRAGLAIHQYAPARIKRAVTGSGAASKVAVASLVASQLGLDTIDGPRDASDALATALCRAEERRGLLG